MDIVQFTNEKYALRSGWFFGYKYADATDLKENNNIEWWDYSDKCYCTFESLEELEKVIENYNPEIPKQRAKEMKEKRKAVFEVKVIKKVKFGCKNPVIKTPV